MSSASVSPVSTLETSSSAEDRFAWENCGSNLVSMRNSEARFANPPILDPVVLSGNIASVAISVSVQLLPERRDGVTQFFNLSAYRLHLASIWHSRFF